MKEQNIGLIFGLLMIIILSVTIVSIGMYIDNTINNNMPEEQADEVYEQARNGTLLRNWAIVFFPGCFIIALIMSYKRKKQPLEL